MAKKVSKLLQKRRRYAETFKKKLVLEFETGQFSVYQLAQLHNLSPQSIYNWIYKYSRLNQKGIRVVEYGDSSEEKLRQLNRQVNELQRLLGQKQVEIEFLDKLIELAGEELGMDLKKTFSTPPSGGSKTIDT